MGKGFERKGGEFPDLVVQEEPMSLGDVARMMDKIEAMVLTGEVNIHFIGLEPGREPKVVVDRIVVKGSQSR